MPEIKIKQVGYADPEVQPLLTEVFDELAQRYGGSGDDTPVAAAEFAPPHGAFFVAVEAGQLIGCAGWRAHEQDAELKRMFTTKAARNRGLARRLLTTVEESARAAGRNRVILETGDKQPEAIALYESAGYALIANFGFYRDHSGVRSYAKPIQQ